MFGLIQIALGAVVISLSSPLWAAEIRWQGEESCRREAEVLEQVESMIGRPISSIEIADFELNVRRLSGDQWSLELTTVRRADRVRSARAIRGASCAEVTDAAAVAIALAIGPAEPTLEPPSRPEPAGDPSRPTPPAKAAPPAGKPPEIPSSLEWFAGLAGALDSSATPSVAVGAALHLGLSWLPTDKSRTRLRFELEGALYAPSETGDAAKAGRFQLFYVAPLVCGERPFGGPTLLGCAGYELGQLSGEGVGAAVTASHPSNTFWSAVRAELGLLVPLASTLRIAGRAGVAVPLIRREFVLDGPEVVFRPAPVSARAELGLELSL
ncbi:MAG TPA: hypothetical protein VJV79_22645 [Polyangiaceae bacterium]|nr:hypothetical protein [Polyangiaceae bacterium]